jgi:SAM-dependent methyltransferase
MNDSRFTRRVCPLCRAAEKKLVFDLRARDFCASNPTYSASYPGILSVAENSLYPVVKCRECGFVYSGFEPSAAFLSLVYEKVIRHEDNVAHNEATDSYARRLAYVSELLTLAPVEQRHRALDFGCGLGMTLRVLKIAGVDCIGYDFSELRSKHAADANLALVRDSESMAAAGPFDLFVCDNVIEHLPDPFATMRLLASTAVPGAIMYVSVPNADARFMLEQGQRLRDGRPVDMSLNPWEHLNYFDLDHLDRMLGQAGFLPVPDIQPGRMVNIGLRAEPDGGRRAKNALASLIRLIKYALTGRALGSPNHRFYRLAPRAL